MSLGVGTKFLTALYCTQDHHVHDSYWGTVRDSHAEVLARRAFLRYLFLNIQSLLQHPTTSPANEIFLPLDAHPFTTSNVEGNTAASISSASCALLHSFQLRPEVKFHFYSSSQPCGNAWYVKGRSIESFIMSQLMPCHDVYHIIMYHLSVNQSLNLL